MTRLPALGRRGEGWFALQLALLAGVAAAGIFLGPDLGGVARLATTVVGAALLAGGLGIAAWGIRDLGASLTPLPRPAADATLVEGGVYARVRHPIYAGVLASGVGWALVTASLPALVLALLLAALLDLKARREEAWLRERYPRYAAYARRTWRFLPRVY